MPCGARGETLTVELVHGHLGNTARLLAIGPRPALAFRKDLLKRAQPRIPGNAIGFCEGSAVRPITSH
ncbi:hypothetical protein GCM10027612_08630 [Microbispora bryophytorum subsp. camponoti]